MKTMLSLALLVSILIVGGCVKRKFSKASKPFQTPELEAVLAINIDMSGSFSGSWKDRAHPLFLKLLDQFFTAGMGARTRVILGQISDKDRVVFFEGTPSDLKRKFRNPDAFHRFLVANSDPSASKVYQATQKTIDYVNALGGVTERTRLVTVILSDMVDSQADTKAGEQARNKMLQSLATFHDKGGGMALYFVSEDEVPRWRSILSQAGFGEGEFVIETSLSEQPQLPRLD